MSATPRTAAAEGLDVVVVGSFNPAILHPQWLLHRKLVDEAELEEAELSVVSPGLAELKICRFGLFCVQDRLTIGTADISRAARMQDFLKGLLPALPEVPMRACGINPWVQFNVREIGYWHKIGHTLVPKELVWNGLFESPGMQSLSIKSPREGAFPGHTMVTIEPRNEGGLAIFVRSNYHYAIPEASLYKDASAMLGQFLESEWKTACEIPRRTADRIFEKIDPA